MERERDMEFVNSKSNYSGRGGGVHTQMNADMCTHTHTFTCGVVEKAAHTPLRCVEEGCRHGIVFPIVTEQLERGGMAEEGNTSRERARARGGFQLFTRGVGVCVYLQWVLLGLVWSQRLAVV